jgi:general secretion pathway protein B
MLFGFGRWRRSGHACGGQQRRCPNRNAAASRRGGLPADIAADPQSDASDTRLSARPVRNRVAAASKPAAQTTTAPAPAANHRRRIDGRVFNLRELPEALQKEIGDSVVISGFSSTAEDSERLVIINDRVRRAGDDVVAGMTLESIQADGVILNYKGYRFRSGSF